MIELTKIVIAAALGVGAMLALTWRNGRRQRSATRLAVLEEIVADAAGVESAHSQTARGNGPAMGAASAAKRDLSSFS